MPSPGGRWRGAAVTDEGDHVGASVVDGRTSVSAHDDHRTHDTHPYPVPSGPPSPWEGEGLGRGNGILPSRLRRATSLSQGRLMFCTVRPPCQRGLASPQGDDWRIPTQQLTALRPSPHPPSSRAPSPRGRLFYTFRITKLKFNLISFNLPSISRAGPYR